MLLSLVMRYGFLKHLVLIPPALRIKNEAFLISVKL